jgi:hypothetical protein
MKLEKWALIAEIVGSVAIVLTLVVLILEVHEGAQQTALNTQSLRVSNYQDLIAQINELNLLQIENRFDLRSVVGATSLEDLSDEEARLVVPIMTMMFRHGDLAFYQYEQGMLTENRLESALRPLTNGLCMPLFREFWMKRFRSNFVSTYRDFVDREIRDKC